ncbi:uncharacterized protein LOC125663402 [Ostrea edulis]|uniref:uncharacterized protein LOC125663402 n=1 Tax=Ostrea edulis TaxID=37623 RepID=UPI0024AF2F77|nr:uncharacterized protein LOC125663402 [Ostrea edulis]
MTLSEIALATQKDEVLQSVMERISRGDWTGVDKDSDLFPYMRVKDKLPIVNYDEGSILLYETKIIMPHTLCKRVVVDLAHEGHQGIVKTKQFLRSTTWFLGLGQQVETICKQYFRWWKLFVIPVFDKIFSIFGIPEVLKTDNGPPFQSSEFAKFASYLGFRHQRITPLWPRTNSEAERFMKTLSKAIKTSNVEGLNWKQELYKFLRNYRAMPHSTTSVSPAESLLGRQLRIKLPGIEHSSTTLDRQVMIERDTARKHDMKQYADLKNHASKSDIKVYE